MYYRILLLAIILCSFGTNLQAATFSTYYCPTTYKTVKLGDSIDAVRAACGNPTSTTTRQEQVLIPVNTVKWIYTLNLKDKSGNPVLIPAFTITLRDQKVIAIERNNLPTLGSSYCVQNGSVNLGDMQDSVLQACGQPNAVNSQQDSTTSTKEVVEWVYNNGPYKPQIIFNFEGGVLKQMGSGALGN